MSHEPGEPLTFQEPDHYSAPAAWAEVKAALREAEEQPQPPPAPSVTSSEIALARTLVAYDAWEPEDGVYDDIDNALDDIGDALDGRGFLEVTTAGRYGPNANALALIGRVRKAGLL